VGFWILYSNKTLSLLLIYLKYQKIFMIDKELLKQAIIEYRIAGKKLMFDLGNKYGLDISNPDDFETLIARRNKTIPKKGALTQRWNIYFHGGACCFYKKNINRLYKLSFRIHLNLGI
jgi:hypothetical protein